MVHLYTLQGQNIAIDSNSGSVHVLDADAYEALCLVNDLISRGEPIIDAFNQIPEDIRDELSQLVSDGLLFSEDKYEADALSFKKRQSVLKAICLHVAHGCNMSCEYCFAGKGEYQGKAGIMSLEVGKATLDFLVANSGDRTNLEVDFFGGEPLLNWDVVKELVRYGRSLEDKFSKHFNFTLTTNGILLDEEVREFCNREMSNVVLSLDGRRDVHDRMRHPRGSNGSYDEILDNFTKLVKSRGTKDYYIRGTYTRYNLDFASDVIAMADMGFKETSIEPVIGNLDKDFALREEDLPKILAEYERLAKEILHRKLKGDGFNFYHYKIDLDNGPCIVKRLSGCGVATEYLAVTPDGDLYPCHQFVSDDEYCLGNIYEGITNIRLYEQFLKSNNLYTRDGCRDCWAKLYCSGGCAANNLHYNGEINKPYEFGCILQRKRIECAIMIEAALQEREES